MKQIKNIFILMSALSIISCRPNDPETITSGGVLPSKIVTTYSNGQIRTNTFTYDGNKILEQKIYPSDVSKIKYTYTGDNITKMENFDGPSYTPSGGTILTYENGKVKTTTNIPVPGYTGSLNRDIYTYNADGTVIVANYSVNQATNVETSNGRQNKLIYTSGNLTKIESNYGGAVQVTDFTYISGKNQAFKNVKGFDQTTAQGNLTSSITYVGTLNPTRTFSYTFNADNYPSQVVQVYNGNQSETQVFTY